jgi:hypothetical protein
MPRPKSDLSVRMFSIAPADLANLDTVAAHHGWLTEAGVQKGEPNRSRAVRELAAREARRIERVMARKGARP